MSNEEEPNPPEKPRYTTKVVSPLRKAIALSIASLVLVCTGVLCYKLIGIWMNPDILQSDLSPIKLEHLYVLVPFTLAVTPLSIWMFKVELNRRTTDD